MSATMLAVKAQAVLAVLVTTRHRTVRMAMVSATVIVLFEAVRVGSGLSQSGSTVLVVSGWLSAVAASRVLAPGAALDAARRVAGPWWLAPAGRLLGTMALVVPVTWVAASLLTSGSGAWPALVRICVGAALYASALAALVMALPPLWGATAAGTLGLLLAVLGVVPPSGMAQLTESWPLVQRPVVLLWNSLPLGWRATHWMQYGGARHLAILALWVGAGVALASWTVARWYRIDRFGAGGA